jgi:hypothetical protein
MCNTASSTVLVAIALPAASRPLSHAAIVCVDNPSSDCTVCCVVTPPPLHVPANTGHFVARLPWPYLLVDCRQQGGALHLMPPPAALQQQQQQQQQCKCRDDPTCSPAARAEGNSRSAGISISSDSSSEGSQLCNGDEELLWLVPAGNLQHEALVSWGTLLVTAVCCLAVSWTALTAQP